MRKVIFGVVVGLLLGAGVVLAQDGAWQGQQWEYAILMWEPAGGGEEESITFLPMVGTGADGLASDSMTSAVENIAQAMVEWYGGEANTTFQYPFFLQELGEQGWELVSSQNVGLNQTMQVFKRPKP